VLACSQFFIALVFCASAATAGEALSVAGFVVRLPNGLSTAPYALQNTRYGDNVAALKDPRSLLRESEWTILKVETTETFAQGLPVMEVIDVLPEYWEQPPVWNSWGKDFGTWAGVGSRIRPEDYARAPLEDRRAHHVDNGLAAPMFYSGGGGGGGTHPPVILHAQLASQALTIRWNVVAGWHYDVLGSSNVASGYAVVGNVTAGASGTASLNFSTSGTQRFFKIRY
jgi:hypothetical protein